MIKTNEEIIEIVKNNFEKVNANINRWGEVEIYTNKKKRCVFDFRKMGNNDQYCAEFFKGHNCLSIGYEYEDGGEEQMIVADTYDLSEKILKYIEKKLSVERMKNSEKYEQLLLF